MSRLKFAVDQILFARGYTQRLLDTIDFRDWFRQPSEGVTHVGWQVGHLAMAQYRLAIERIRGTRPEDEALISRDFLALFGKGSVPDPDAGKYPAAKEILGVFQRVHERSLAELQQLGDDQLDEPVLTPHSLAKTKFDSLMWCGHHEMSHAGQIGLLRRLLGEKPIW